MERYLPGFRRRGSAQAGTDIKMTSQVLRSLERKGLIEREIDTADRRARRLRVTTRGARLAPRAIEIVEQVDSHFFADVPEAEALRFLRRLVQLPKALEPFPRVFSCVAYGR